MSNSGYDQKGSYPNRNNYNKFFHCLLPPVLILIVIILVIIRVLRKFDLDN